MNQFNVKLIKTLVYRYQQNKKYDELFVYVSNYFTDILNYTYS